METQTPSAKKTTYKTATSVDTEDACDEGDDVTFFDLNMAENGSEFSAEEDC